MSWNDTALRLNLTRRDLILHWSAGRCAPAIWGVYHCCTVRTLIVLKRRTLSAGEMIGVVFAKRWLIELLATTTLRGWANRSRVSMVAISTTCGHIGNLLASRGATLHLLVWIRCCFENPPCVSLLPVIKSYLRDFSVLSECKLLFNSLQLSIALWVFLNNDK